MAILLVFLALPLQGVAASIHALSCLSGGEGLIAPHSQVHGHDDGAQGPSHQHDNDTGTTDASHFCCNFVAPGILAASPATVQAWPPIFDSPISLPATLFIPERPQRPPRI